jgi:hypothetical protein
MGEVSAGLPWALVVALLTYSGWLHLELRKLHVKSAELARDVKAMAESGTIGTIINALDEMKRMQQAMAVRIDADYHRIALCLISISRGDHLTMADLQRPAT